MVSGSDKDLEFKTYTPDGAIPTPVIFDFMQQNGLLNILGCSEDSLDEDKNVS